MDIDEKTPGEPVPVADREAESLLTAGLQALLPGAAVVGEEASHGEPHMLDALKASYCWLVDPLGGTANFIAGSDDYAMMVTLLRSGETVAAWILQPAHDALFIAERGSGAFRNRECLLRQPAPDVLAELRGAALTRFLNPEQRGLVISAARAFADLGPGRVCAGIDYPPIVTGMQDFVMFWRTLPWDHAPSAPLLTEAGGFVGSLDGLAYSPTATRHGLVAAADVATHKRVAQALSLN